MLKQIERTKLAHLLERLLYAYNIATDISDRLNLSFLVKTGSFLQFNRVVSLRSVIFKCGNAVKSGHCEAC